MIQVETRIVNGNEYRITYSDTGKMIVCGTTHYGLAYDPVDVERKYEETDVQSITFVESIPFDIVQGVAE